MRKGKLMGKVFAIAMVCLMIVALLAAGMPWGTISVSAQEPRTWYVDDDLADYHDADFTKIQDAVDAASPA